MALASVLERLLPVNWHGFFIFGSPADFLDLGPGSSSDGLSLAVPAWGVPEEGHIEMLHGTTIQAFKFQHEVIVAADSQATVTAYIAS
ncbi:Proteasome subunit beta type-5 [Sciurus carolinensis]|uniref:Proteasome subunit beta type-5 n=1 Tax=Sciurus carolinensis TaxID=30640 RepID=A0AA41MIX7_SCICA|nr:Proteasome subunit beta type-5 [Sciurus carolinensis]